MCLNENQERSVGVTLRLLEERLARIERVIGEDEEGIMYRREARLSPEQRQKMHGVIASIREEIQRAAERFQLRKEDQNAAHEIVATLSLMWQSLEESRPRRLRAYGEVDPTLDETLDPLIQQMIRLLFRLQAIALEG